MIEDKYKNALDYIYSIPKFTGGRTLQDTRRILMRLVGEGYQKPRVIHVAGTNGKGSVCSFLYHILLAGKKKTAMFTSPHLVQIEERIQINGAEVTREKFLKGYEAVRKEVDREEKKISHPSFFEFLFLMAMKIFSEEELEYLILETGLGGRMDATNVFESVAISVITSVSLDHTEVLGDTLEKIAREKAGIIKSNAPVVFFQKENDVTEEIQRQAEGKNAKCFPLSNKNYRIHNIKGNLIDFSNIETYDRYQKTQSYKIQGRAAYQVENAVLARKVISILDTEQTISEKQIQEGLFASNWIGRMEEVLPNVILEGAHNIGGIEELVKTVQRMQKEGLSKAEFHLLFAVMKDKDYSKMIQTLCESTLFNKIHLVSFENERGLGLEKVYEEFKKQTNAFIELHESTQIGLTKAIEQKRQEDILFCTGSLYFIGAIKELLGGIRYDKF